MTTIAQALKAATTRIDKLDARLLLQHVLGQSRTYLLTHDREELETALAAQYDALIARREAGEPFAYIVGSQAFYGRDFKVTPATLIPRPDTETLIDTVLEELKRHPAKSLLDMGTGTGCIAITLALECKGLEVFASDISPEALTVAKANNQALHANVTFYEGAWYAALPQGVAFDVIVSNPPYIEAHDKHLAHLTYEPLGALTDGYNGLTDLEKIIRDADRYLSSKGLLVLEHGFDQGAAVRAMFDEKQWEAIETIKDLGGNDRITKARLKN